MGIGIKKALKSGLSRILTPPLRARFEKFQRGSAFSEPEMSLIPYFCNPTLNSVDVGASNGEYTYEMARLSKRCFAFEANRDIASALENKVLSNVTVLPVALSDRAENRTLVYPDIHGPQGTAWGTLQTEDDERFRNISLKKTAVQTKTLDEFELAELGFIKIDVEGHETEVLRGALGTIRTSRPFVQIEIEERHRKGALKQICGIFDGLKYGGYFLQNGTVHSIAEFDPEIHQNDKNAMQISDDRDVFEDTGNTRCYINNFIFIPEESRELARTIRAD